MEPHVSDPAELEIPDQKKLRISPVLDQKLASNKSLCGNKGNRSKRIWRGKHPIQESENNDSFRPVSNSRELEMNESAFENRDHGHKIDVGCDFLLPRWLKTGKRRNHGKAKALIQIPASSSSLDLGISRPGNGGCDLSKLETGKIASEKLPPKKRKLDFQFLHKGSTIHSSLSKKTKINVNCYSSPSGSKIKIIESKASENKKLANPGAEKILPRPQKNHVCNKCGRSFTSYQALGGHKAHHNKIEKAEKIVSSTSEDSTGSSSSSAVADTVPQCTICNRIFSSKQALGGHKRYCKGPEAVDEADSGVSQVTQNKPQILDFDLNQYPPEWISQDN